MNIKGRIIEIFETQQVSEKFKKREFVIEYGENTQYPEYIKFETVQDKVNLIDAFRMGEEIDVFFNLRGRAWTNQQGVKNYFNSLQAWKINRAEGAANNYQQAAPAQRTTEANDSFSQTANVSDGDGSDDLPF